MMTEQQMTLKSNYEADQRWRECIVITCYAYRQAEIIRENVELATEIARQVINSLYEVFKPFMQEVSIAFEEVKDLLDMDFEDLDDKSYPQSYQHNVNNYKVNTKGFPRPIYKCARSRC